MDNRIFEYASRLSKKYGTRDPFDILEYCLPNTKLKISDRYDADGLKGYATIQVRGQKFAVINGKLCPEEQRVVAAHELGHLILDEFEKAEGHDEKIQGLSKTISTLWLENVGSGVDM